jgi:uncharacterized Zn finger protein
LFPAPKQIAMDCSCPDGAVMCKHVAAVLYGVGARLDESPELFFQLRNVDHSELITTAGSATTVARPGKPGKVLKSADLAGIFGIDVDAGGTGGDAPTKTATPKKKSTTKLPAAKKAKPKSAAKRPAVKKARANSTPKRPVAKKAKARSVVNPPVATKAGEASATKLLAEVGAKTERHAKPPVAKSAKARKKVTLGG